MGMKRFHLFHRALLGLSHDVSVTDSVELGKLIHGHLYVSLIKPELLVELINIAELSHVLHEEREIRGIQVSVRALGKVQHDLVFKSRIPDELFQVRNELGVASRLFLAHL